MRKIAFLFSCLGSIGYARRVQGSPSEDRQRPLNLIDVLAEPQDISNNQLTGNLKQRSTLASLLLAHGSAAAFNPVLSDHRVACRKRGRPCNVVMKKGKGKSIPFEGGKPLGIPSLDAGSSAQSDTVPMDVVLKRLKEVPVFTIRTLADVGDNATEDGYIVNKQNGFVQYYMNPEECKFLVRQMQGWMSEEDMAKTEMVTVDLDKIIFEKNVVLNPSRAAINDVLKVPKSQSMVDEVRVPIFCIDGLMVRDSNTGKMETPIFFTRQGCIDMAREAIPDCEQQIMLGDLSVIVANMLNGPAGPLRDAAFLADNGAYVAWREIRENSASLFGEKTDQGFGQMLKETFEEATKFRNPFR